MTTFDVLWNSQTRERRGTKINLPVKIVSPVSMHAAVTAIAPHLRLEHVSIVSHEKYSKSSCLINHWLPCQKYHYHCCKL